MSQTSYQDSIAANYKFDDANDLGKDSSGNAMHAVPMGTTLPEIKEIAGRNAVYLAGGTSGTSYLNLPSNVLKDISDNDGITLTTWVYCEHAASVWERIFDFGKQVSGPYLFLTRGCRGVCFAGEDIYADAAKALPNGQWIHIALTVSGTKQGTLSSAGPILYINGEVAADGSISQTTSGLYAKFRNWFSTFEDKDNYVNNHIGKSKFDADADFHGALSDFRIYSTPVDHDGIIEIMCDSLSDKEIVTLAKDKYLAFPNKIITGDLTLPSTLMGNKVQVTWESSNPSVFQGNGKMQNITEAAGITMTAVLTKGSEKESKSFNASVVPSGIAPYTLTIQGNEEVLDISDTLYGLFYEDINNAADGGIYAELVMNRSFEAFTFDTYDPRSGENGISTGRNYNPLAGWYGDTDKMTVCDNGGLNDFFGIEDKEVNSHYVTVSDAVIQNRGYSDSKQLCSMFIREKEDYLFTVWAKSEQDASITLVLKDSEGNVISTSSTIAISGNTWKQYGIDTEVVLTGEKSTLGQLELQIHGTLSMDMVSLYPRNVWGASEEASSSTAHTNYKNNRNYRLRKDMVEALIDLNPKFLRFPGGCISEGSWIWDNVYDWKDSVGRVEIRKENFNVWGYDMTMGLGYFEYFQLAEDLQATPLPVMACGVLCQARSNYANPSCGSLREKYIQNFLDLIDFAINTDTENNKWAKLRKEMGHEQPFELHYLGVGNENWEPKFMANFEVFYKRVTDHLKENYPGYPMYIISTVGPQADDDAYKECWKFLAGKYTGEMDLPFSDGKESHIEHVKWYENQSDYMETIADEHYYRPNQYMLNNADRYNYYSRAYNEDGSIADDKISKVFVGEYASTDKNTLAGAISEAAVMTGFEKNSDVVRLTAYAPLFNKVLNDGTYRWTPDLIWFDDESVWRTPNYYVQQLYAKYLGKKLLATSFQTYIDGVQTDIIPRGGIEIATRKADILVQHLTVIANDQTILVDTDFANGMPEGFEVIPGSSNISFSNEGMLLSNNNENMSGIYCIRNDWTNYKVIVHAKKLSGIDGFYVGAGVTEISEEKKTCIEYAIAIDSDTTGVKVFKEGIEGYTLGDFATSKCAGNLRHAAYEPIEENKEYTITVDYGTDTGKNLVCSYSDQTTTSQVLDYKLEAYHSDLFHSVTKDDSHVYVKLVNADSFEKTTDLVLSDLKVKDTAKRIVLTGEEHLVHVPNVNKKNEELIVPVENTLKLTGNTATLSLPANSVTVLVFDL